MMYELFSEPRNWKWMTPAALAAPAAYWWNKWWMMGGEWEELSIIPLGLMIIMLLAAALNFFLYAWHYWSQFFADVKAAVNATPEVRMFEAARTMHPEAVKALLVHRRTVWRIKYVPLRDTVDWIFDEAPSLHAGFVDFVFDHSSNGSVMSKHKLSDGSRKFDPEELVTDYQQYDDLLHLMQAKLMCSQAFGNQPPKWLPPWNADLARHIFGLDGAPYAADENISEAMKAVIRAQAKWSGNGNGLKDLGSPQPAVTPARSAGEAKLENDGPEITDDELAATQKIQAEHDAQWQLSRVEKIFKTSDQLNRQTDKQS